MRSVLRSVHEAAPVCSPQIPAGTSATSLAEIKEAAPSACHCDDRASAPVRRLEQGEADGSVKISITFGLKLPMSLSHGNFAAPRQTIVAPRQIFVAPRNYLSRRDKYLLRRNKYLSRRNKYLSHHGIFCRAATNICRAATNMCRAATHICRGATKICRGAKTNVAAQQISVAPRHT